MRRVLLSFVILTACRGDGRSPDRAPVSAAEPAAGSADVPPAVTVTADAATTAPGTAGAPPGTDALTPVPAPLARAVKLARVVTGLARPVLLTHAPGDPRRRLFIVEQHVGRIRILERGKLLPKPFFTIGGLAKGNEQGLLGLAFHPRFAENGRLYVNYTAADKDTHIVEYRVSAQDPDVVDLASRREIIEIDQPYSNHNGGHLSFGPDGKLYTGMGDGGAAGDPLEAGQDRKALLGKILRFDVDAAKPAPEPGTKGGGLRPAPEPGTKGGGLRPAPEIVHLGVRNPWRFWFDPPTGALYIGDVGQNLWEYVFVVSGTDGVQHNFGWNVVEGNHCYQAKTCDRAGFTPPVAEYPHAQGCSITGGVTYRGKALPMLAGRYFYADYCTALVRSFVWTHDPSSPTAKGWIREHHDWKAALDPDGDLAEISSFGVDHDGEVYVVLLTGTIYKLVPRA